MTQQFPLEECLIFDEIKFPLYSNAPFRNNERGAKTWDYEIHIIPQTVTNKENQMVAYKMSKTISKAFLKLFQNESSPLKNSLEGVK